MYNLNSNHVKPKRSQKILTKHPNSVGRFQCFERFDSFFGLVNSLFPWFVLFVRLLILPFSLVVMFNCLAFIITPYHFRKSSDSIHATCSIYVNLFRKSQWLMDYPEGRLWIVTNSKRWGIWVLWLSPHRIDRCPFSHWLVDRTWLIRSLQDPIKPYKTPINHYNPH